jgi:hypothetical protein
MAKNTVGNLIVSLRADLSGLKLDVREMQGTFEKGFSNIQKSATSFGKNLAGSLGLGLSIGAVVSYGKSIIDLGGQLKDLSEQTGISGQTLSGIKSVLEENGTSLDAFAKGIFTLQKNLGGITNASDPAAIAVKALGLNLDQLRQADTETFLKLIVDALGKIENPINRAALGAQLLGKSARELGPAIKALVGNLEELRKSGLSDDQLNRLDDFGDAWTRFSNKLKFGVADALLSTIDDLQTINRLIQQNLLLLRSGTAGAGALLGGTAGPFGEDILKQSLNPPPKIAPPKVLPDKAAQSAVDSFIESLRKQADALKISQIELGGGGQAAKEMGLNFEFAAFKAKLLADGHLVPAKLTEQFQALKKEILGLNVELTKAKELFDRIAIDEADLAEGRKAQEAILLEPFKLQDANEIQRTAEAAARAAQDFDDMAEATRAWADEGGKASRIGDELTISLQAIDKDAAIVGPMFEKTGAQIAAFQDALRNLARGPEWDELKAKLDNLVAQKAGQDLFVRLADSMESGISNTLRGIEEGSQTLGEGMKNLARNMVLSFQEELLKLSVINPIKNWLEDMIFGAGQGPGRSATFAGIFGGALGGAAAASNVAASSQMQLPDFEGWTFELKDAFQNIDTTMLDGLQGLSDIGMSGFGNLFTSLGSIISDALSGLGDFISGGEGGGGFSGLISGALSALGSFLFFKQGGLVPAFANGGMVRGIPRFDDGGLAIVHPGEFVTRANSVRSMGAGNLEYMNRTGQMPRIGGDTHNYYQIDARGAQRGVSREIRQALEQTKAQAVNESLVKVQNERMRSSRMAGTFGK